MGLLAFLHTSAGNRALVAGRLRRSGVHSHVLHRVEANLHEVAPGPARDAVMASAVDRLRRLGAARIICTCSTVGDAAERAGRSAGVPTSRVDRPLMRAAAARGGTIAVVIASPSTRAATLALLRDEAVDLGVAPRVRALEVPVAWRAFTAGRTDLYIEQIAAVAREALVDHDLVVLAQLSMSPAAAGLGPNVLTSLEFMMADVHEFLAV